MPSYVIKIDPDRDEYVYWSTITEEPVAWGSKTEIETLLFDLGEAGDNQRMSRADEFGTSCRDLGDGLRFYDWATPSLIYRQQGTIWRDDLWALCSRLARGQEVNDLIQPLEDD